MKNPVKYWKREWGREQSLLTDAPSGAILGILVSPFRLLGFRHALPGAGCTDPMFQGRQQCRVSKGRPSTCLPPGGPELPSLTGRAAPRQAAHRESKGQAPSRRMGTVSAVLPCEPGQGQGTHRGHPGGIGRRWTKKNAARRRQILSVASAAVGGLCSRHLTYQDPAHTRAA